MAETGRTAYILSPWDAMLASYLEEAGATASGMESFSTDSIPDAVVLISASATARDDRELFDSLMRVEKEMEKRCASAGIPFTLIRPGYMFGDGVEGKMAELFEEVRDGRYIHLRGNDATLPVICAYDVARAAIALAGKPGTYYATDGRPARLLDIAEAMSANQGARKRMWHLPPKWARVLGKVPGLRGILDPERFGRRSKSLVLDPADFLEAIDFKPFDTLAIISRESKDYPYHYD